MKFNGKFKIKSSDVLLKERGLEDMGAVQQYIDSECIRLMKPYTPKLSGALENSATVNTVIGSGLIKQSTPYARYQYYGEVYAPSYPIIKGGVLEGFFSPPKKEATGKAINYNTTINPLAGSHWFERMKSEHKDEILAGARKIAGGKS